MSARLAALAIATGGVIGSCATSDGAPVAEDPPPDARAAAVGIVVDGCTLADEIGSGVVVGEVGQVVTVAHTLSGARGVTVVAADGREHEATITAFDPDADLAVLDVPTLEVAPLPVADGTVELGTATVLGWSPEAGSQPIEVEVSRRLIITIEDIYVEAEVTRTGMELAGDIDVGVSGAAVIDADGAVAGIVYARSRGREAIGFATDAAELRDLLDDRPQGSADRCRS
ncbi:MAG: trypsin-like peptidase domain-containing protein [Ilumatobacter sp.]